MKNSEIRSCVPDGVHQTFCELCPSGCAMDVHIKEGEVTKVAGNRHHPVNQGFLCPKGLAIKDIVYAKDRILSPMKNDDGRWRRIDWDEALDLCAEKLNGIKEKHGPRSFAVALGMPVFLGGNSTVGFLRRFWDVFGTPNCFSVESICFRCRIIASILTMGKLLSPDIPNAKTILVWGNNPHASNPPAAERIRRALRKGARLLVIDPRRTPVASMADLHLQIRPGTDGALALGMIHVILDEELYDREFVENWTVGFEQLKEVAAGYDLRSVQGITGIPSEGVRSAARLFATNSPSCILQGTNGLDQHVNGLQNSRALAILYSITGNVDKKGGMVTASRVHTRPLRMPEKMQGVPLGVDEFPLFYEVWGRSFGEGQGMKLADTILSGDPYPIAGLMVSACNPALTWPNANKLGKAISTLEFAAVMDMRMTATARLCNLFLPAATFLEKTELCDYYGTLQGIPYVAMRRKLLQAGEAKSDMEFYFELARRMGYQEFFPWKGVEEALDYALLPTGLSVSKFKQSPGFPLGEVNIDYYLTKGFRTPSGKVELFSRTLQELGHDPVPCHQDSPESPWAQHGSGREYPLLLTTGARIREFLHSEHRDIPKLRKRHLRPLAEIHPETAKPLLIDHGEVVSLETRVGSIEIEACLTEDILPGVVSVSHGWEEANVNVLTDDASIDPITGYPLLKSLSCRIRKRS